MKYVIRIDGFANGAPCPVAGEYVKSFDVDAGNGRGEGEFTANIDEAMKFSTKATAWLFWRRPSSKRPLRFDGAANRPMTCSNVTIMPWKGNGDG